MLEQIWQDAKDKINEMNLVEKQTAHCVQFFFIPKKKYVLW